MNLHLRQHNNLALCQQPFLMEYLYDLPWGTHKEYHYYYFLKKRVLGWMSDSVSLLNGMDSSVTVSQTDFECQFGVGAFEGE